MVDDLLQGVLAFANSGPVDVGIVGSLCGGEETDTELHGIVDALQNAQRRNIWQLHATVRQIGRHPHASSMEIDVERDSPTWQPIADGADDTIVEALRDLAHWLYRQLRDAYEAETSDCAVDEALAVNEYTFTKDGKRFG